MPREGGIAQEANALGKAQGYADVGTVVRTVERLSGVRAMTPNDSWESLPWFLLEQDLFRLQKRIYQASLRGDYSSIRSLQKLLLSSRAAKLIAVRRVTPDNMGKRTVGVDGICSIPPEHRLERWTLSPGGSVSLPCPRSCPPKRHECAATDWRTGDIVRGGAMHLARPARRLWWFTRRRIPHGLFGRKVANIR
jgi:hypothetical protein